MDKFKREQENFDKFENFIRGLDPEQAKEFIIEFFKKYKYLLSEDITRVTDRDLLKVIQHKNIAVVAQNIQDFGSWAKSNKLTNIAKHPRYYKKDNTTYIGITIPEEVIGYNFHEVIYTDNARGNKFIKEIKINIAPCLIKNK